MSVEIIINELLDISKGKYRYLQILLGIEKNLSKSIELDKPQDIVRQIELKDKYTLEISELDMKFYTLFNKLKSGLGIDTIEKIKVEKYPQVKELKKIVGEILKLTEEIGTVDNENTQILEKGLETMGNKLRAMKQGGRVSNAYRAHKKIEK
ncbi:MAG: flagellar protein FlgN [Clostridia bacterium]|nr:flagellar protein FlgN [Clostridia bacterium]